VPLGTGMDDLPQFGAILKEIGFSGPIEVQAEYPTVARIMLRIRSRCPELRCSVR